jgi:mxaJ protein
VVTGARDHQRLHQHHEGARLRIVVAAFAMCLGLGLAAAAVMAEAPRELVVCADPNNLPFSNRAQQGFENEIIELVAKDLARHVRYVWWAQRRGYVRNTLNDSRCDVWPGMATGVDVAATTRPYYRSSYVFVTRADADFGHLTLDDPRLKHAAIGVQMIGNDSMNTPPAHAIAGRGIVDNVRGYMVYGDYRRDNPPAAIIDAVAHREIDVGLVWGPLAGYFVNRSKIPLRTEPVTPAADPRWPMTFAISMAVRRGNRELLEQINESLAREESKIDAILEAYHVPRENIPAGSGATP